MDIYLSRTQGFCSGVSYAIDIVERALVKYGTPLYVYHEIVHNTHVVNKFKDKGVKFIDDLNTVPNGSVLILSAHGVPPVIFKEAEQKKLNIIDATCPLVKRVHNQAVKLSNAGYHTILIGHKGHQEVIGTSGYVKLELLHVVDNIEDINKLDLPADAKIGYVTQTTLSQDETNDMILLLQKKFTNLKMPDRSDVCYATQNRQNAVKELAQLCELIIVCGSSNSSNTNRLKETGERLGTKSIIIDEPADLNLLQLSNIKKLGITSGASVPHYIVEKILNIILKSYPQAIIHNFDNPEKNAQFKLPEI
ncbi:MAG: 4-hydroxy-3-methylbut-2-enyl diphosphate reductase [Candidatus Omnitrophica bacterium]|nr:4-hydroxy-3-methylbut-2-enyl diphosphate reductase [Candidatus Omnitrophota bacterium]